MCPTDFAKAFERAQRFHAQGRLVEAEREYRQLAVPGPHQESVLAGLADLYEQTGRLMEAIHTLVSLTEEVPDSLDYCARLAGILEQIGQNDAAISHYQRLLRRQPDMPEAHFNLALLYKKDRRYACALAEYDAAIRLEIDHIEEVYSNMGVLYSEMREADKARQMYERALEVDPAYIPALFNYAGLREEVGERGGAIELYRRILAINPRHWDSLARLAYAQTITAADQPLVESLRKAIDSAQDDRLAREGLCFALGKALDDLKQFEEAMAAYRAANELGKLRNPAYQRQAFEQAVDQLIRTCDPAWMRRVESGSIASPIFICGMFRSGSTLVEQILAGHPSVSAGGELDYLPWLVRRRLAPYPQRLERVTREELQQLGSDYQTRLRGLFPHAEHITDKRPDNFLHLGLIKALFPQVRIVYTKRNRLDNCLSIYFQQLGGNLNYATDLDDIAHYYGQHERLMAQWQARFGDNIVTVDYDELVRSPEPVVRGLLEFLGLEWDARCLAFQQSDSLVKTASVWQVREALHRRSSGRWRNYAPFVPDFAASR